MDKADHTPRILCVEDQNEGADWACVLFQDYDVTMASGLNQATYYAAEEPFDLCVIDYHPPDGEIPDLYTELRPLLDGTPVVLVCRSATISRGDARAIGASELLASDRLSFTSDLIEATKRLLNAGVSVGVQHVH